MSSKRQRRRRELRDLRREGPVSRLGVIQLWATDEAGRYAQRWAEEHDGQHLDRQWVAFEMLANIGVDPDWYVRLLASDPSKLADYEEGLARTERDIADYEAILLAARQRTLSVPAGTAHDDPRRFVLEHGPVRAARIAENDLEELYQRRSLKWATLRRVRELVALAALEARLAVEDLLAGIERHLRDLDRAAANLSALYAHRAAGLPPPAPPFLFSLAGNVSAMSPPARLLTPTPQEAAA